MKDTNKRKNCIYNIFCIQSFSGKKTRNAENQKKQRSQQKADNIICQSCHMKLPILLLMMS